MTTRRAYVVRPMDIDHCCDAGCEVYFAGSISEAAALGAAHYEIDARQVLAELAPWADAYPDGRIPAKAWLDEGYAIGCDGCETMVGYDEEDADGRPIKPVFEGLAVYCTKMCQTKRKRERARWLRLKAAATERLESRIPGCAIEYILESYIAQCTGKHSFTAVARFTFPGGKHAADYCHACRLTFCNPDDEAALRAARRGKR